MKRFRVIVVDFDSRALTLDVIQDHWEDRVKELHRQNQERAIARLKAEYGELGFETKLENFKALGA